MVHDVIRGLRNHGFEAFVAPYEADAQLTFLAHSGKVDFVISEDSDLLVFGCSPILFKYDVRRKIGLEFAGSITDIPEFRGLSHDGCVTACILAGCDSGPSVPGIGLKRAVHLVSRAHGTRDSVNAMNSRVYDQLVLRGFKFGDRDAFVQALRVSIRASSASLRGGYDHCISEHVSDEFRRIGRYLAIAPHLQTEAGQTERVVLRELAPPKSARSLPVMRMDVVSLELRSLISALKADVSERPADSSVSGESDITVESDQVVSGSTVAPFTAAHDGEFLLFEMDP
jgi:hypothetical protein